MANKRVSELAPVTAPELDFADLLLLSDISAHESKKLQLNDLSSFLLLDGRLTGSLLATSSYALNAATASYVSFVSASYANISSLAYNANTASYVLSALSSSYSPSSSCCVTASYALTSSVQLIYSSSFTDYARTSSYLLLSLGQPNGTASYALTASYILGISVPLSGSYASTSSWALNAITASRALSSVNSDTASFSPSSSYLIFNGTSNGTASYALSSGNILSTTIDYGIFKAITQTISSSQIDYVSVTTALGGTAKTTVEAYGTVDIPFTSSNSPTNGYLELFIVNRQYGYSQSLDASPVYLGTGGSSTISGTLRYPFTLCGDAELYGLYEVYVTASNGVYIEGSRVMRFKFTSETDQFVVSSAEPMNLATYPTNSILLYSSSLNPGVAYQGSASQVTFSGSIDATELLVPPATVNVMNYTWTLMGLQKLTVDGNTGLTYLGGIPTNCISVSAANCGLIEIPLLASSSIGYLNVPDNTIIANLSLPQSMSYLDVSNNFYVSLLHAFPASMSVIKADGTGITHTPTSVPDTLISMSFSQCTQLSYWSNYSLPTSLIYLNVNNSPLINFSFVIPNGLLFVDVSNCSLSSTIISNIASALVANGLSNGYFAFLNNPSSGSAFNIIPNVDALEGLGWTVVS